MDAALLPGRQIIILASNVTTTGPGLKFTIMMTEEMNVSGNTAKPEDSFYDHSDFLKSGSTI